VSLDSSGAQGNSFSLAVAISVDGRHVVFHSDATNFLPNDANGSAYDVFVRDLPTGTTELVSQNSSGVQADSDSFLGSISADGRFVVFESDASNLVVPPTNPLEDVYLRDRQSGTTELVCVNTSGNPGNGRSRFPSISADGRYVAFESGCSDLVATDVNGAATDVFVRDLALGITELVSQSSSGTQGNHFSGRAAISADGRYVAFHSGANNLVPGDANANTDVFVRDRLAGTTQLVSRSTSGAQGDGESVVGFPFYLEHGSISSDGRYVAFWSAATNFVAGDTNGPLFDVFVRDLVLGTTELVSQNSSGVQGNGESIDASISADGRYVAFQSLSTNLVPADANGNTSDVFVRDRRSGATELVSQSSSGVQGNGGSVYGLISADGRFVAFASGSSNLDPGDVNGFTDVFLRDRGIPSVPATFCTAKTNSLGCVPAIGSYGTPSASAGSGFYLTARNELNGQLALFFYGTTGSTLLPFQGGFLCFHRPIHRSPPRSSGGSGTPATNCSGSFRWNFNAYISSGADPSLVAGQQVWAQAWSRDPGLLPPEDTSISDAITFVIAP